MTKPADVSRPYWKIRNYAPDPDFNPPSWRRSDANLTRFFRFPDQFVRLRAHLLEIIPTTPVIRILSAGAATGEEAISALIVVLQTIEETREVNPELPPLRLEVVAVDINQENIAAFEANEYWLCPKRAPQLAAWEIYFDRLPGNESDAEHFRVSLKPEFQRMITYVKANLGSLAQLKRLKQDYGQAGFTAVFFNVVAMYMTRSAGEQAKHALKTAFLAPGGKFLSTA